MMTLSNSTRLGRPLAIAATLALGCAAIPSLSTAQGRNCGAHEAVMARLAEGYGETRQAIALAADNTVVEIYASLETGTWTITVTLPGGPTCLVSAGVAYQPMDEMLPGAESGA